MTRQWASLAIHLAADAAVLGFLIAGYLHIVKGGDASEDEDYRTASTHYARSARLFYCALLVLMVTTFLMDLAGAVIASGAP